MIITGNEEIGLAGALHTLYPDATYCSRSNGYDLCTQDGQYRFSKEALDHDVVIISSALWKFN